MSLLSWLYFWLCFMFGIYYWDEVFNPNESNDVVGTWMSVIFLSVIVTPVIWPLLLVYKYKRYQVKKKNEEENLKRDVERRSRNWGNSRGPGMGC